MQRLRWCEREDDDKRDDDVDYSVPAVGLEQLAHGHWCLVVTSRSLGVGAGPGGACGLRWWAQVLPVPSMLLA